VRITAVPVDPALLDLPWSLPLAEWTSPHLVALPQGISRHIVRFVRISGVVYAVKEAGGQRAAEREYDLLRALERLDAPAVEAVGIVSDRSRPLDPYADPSPLPDRDEELPPILITRHLQFSLPYRAVFAGTLRPDTLTRLLDALAVLLVRLHLT